jgi:predicted peptidase
MKTFFTLICLLVAFSSQAQRAIELQFKGRKLPVQSYEIDTEYEGKIPFILFLHGAGERGTDNHAQTKVGLPILMNSLKAAGMNHYILWAPQCPTNQRWTDVDWKSTTHTLKSQPTWPFDVLMHAVDSLVANNPAIDPNRIYIFGLSMGGYGTWEYCIRRPDLFAAAMPVCGGGDVTQAKLIRNTAIYAYHGNADNVVPVSNTIAMVEATKKVNKNVHLVLYDGVGHNAWDQAFADQAAIKKMLAVRKKN